MISVVFAGSRFPVGSSHSSSFGLLTSARAIAVRCCSPPDSSLGIHTALVCKPDEIERAWNLARNIFRVRAGYLQRERDIFPDRFILQ